MKLIVEITKDDVTDSELALALHTVATDIAMGPTSTWRRWRHGTAYGARGLFIPGTGLSIGTVRASIAK